ncbi:MAG: DUF6152 family protein [Gammaproteobacteria bacterium]
MTDRALTERVSPFRFRGTSAIAWLRSGPLVSMVLFLVASSVDAHHGFAPHYDPEQHVTIEGTISRLDFVNPHSFVYVEVESDAGELDEYWCEMQSRSQLERKGVTAASFAIGAQIRIDGFQARRDPLGCEFAAGILPDGTELVLRNETGQSQYFAEVIQSESGVLGTWHRKTFPGAGINPSYREFFTDAAREAVTEFDVIADNPILSCNPMSAIQSWAVPGLPIVVRWEGDDIIIQHEFMDIERVVHMSVDSHPTDVPRTELGYSIGRFEGDDLFIESAQFSEGYLHSGIVRSEGFRLNERLSIDPENGDLVVTWTATDPLYYTDTLEGSRILVRTNLEISPYDCVPEVGHGSTNK